MSVLGGTLREFLEFMAARARAFPHTKAMENELQHELDSFLALGLAAYEELGELTREATAREANNGQMELVMSEVREAHARYLDACQPVLGLIERARPMGVEPKRLNQFMATVGEANLIANRYEKVLKAESEADRSQTRTMEEVRNELRGRIHPSGR